ncbi:hypothetical protein NQZ79_g2054 [Umbelopsis isabellina]|nr:hypothetical protein NQZ79_g2054 [Umbelopsis isabellina]
MLSLEDVLQSENQEFRLIWDAASVNLHSTFKRARQLKKSILRLKVDQNCQYLSRMENALPMNIQSSLLIGIAKIHHQQCRDLYNNVKNTLLWLNRSLTSSKMSVIDSDTIIARLDSITLNETHKNIELLDLYNGHPFENMVAHRYHLLDPIVNVQPCPLETSNIYEMSDQNPELVEAPPMNLLPATSLNSNELEFDIQEFGSVDDNDQFLLSPVWQYGRNTPESDETVAFQRDNDNLWSLRQDATAYRVGAMNQIQLPGTYELTEPHQLSRIHEVVNESGMSHVSTMTSQSKFLEVVNHGNITEDISDNSYDTISDPYKLEELGVYLDHDIWLERQHQNIQDTETQRNSRKRLLRIDQTTELDEQQICDMLSAGAHAFELKEMWRQQYQNPGRHVTQSDRTSEIRGNHEQDFLDNQGALFAVSIDDILNLEQPEEARGPAVNDASDNFIWNQIDYHGDESNDANESRSGLDRNAASEVQEQAARLSGIDSDTSNFYIYANRLLLASSSTETEFGNLFPKRSVITRSAAAQAFVNILSKSKSYKHIGNKLASCGLLQLKQTSPYAEISISLVSKE